VSRRLITLRGSVAAFALVAATTFAVAQEPSKDKAPQAKEPHAAAQPMNKAPAAAEKGQTAQQPNRRAEDNERANKGGKAATDERAIKEKSDKSAEEPDRATKGSKATADEHPPVGDKAGKAAEEQPRKQSTMAPGSNHTTQGTARSGANVQLSTEQRTKIRSVVLQGGAPRVTNVNFNVTIGTVVPQGGVEIVPVPETLVEIAPEWSGFLYFVYGEEIVIIDPDSRTIVAVIAV
jgi:Protein of unknown function (DUF1236)